MPAPRRSWLVFARWVIAAIVLVFVAWALARQWRQFRDQPLVVHPSWPPLLVSAVLVLASYAVLIQTWRLLISSLGGRLSFLDAARIWCVSNLGRYVPGKVWQIFAMGAMAQQRRVSPAAATGSAIISTVVNIGVGMAIAVAMGWTTLNTLSGGHATVGIILLVSIVLGLVALPVLLPWVVLRVERGIGRDLGVGRLPTRAIGAAVLGNVIAWLLYGLAFQALVRGVIGRAPGRWTDYVAVWASSYVLGYLAFFIPGGVGVREGALAEAMTALGIATAPQAAVAAVASRLWLTIFEILPGLLFGARRPAAPPATSDIPPTDGSA